MARVVMLTAAAGPGLNLQYGDVFETDQATADRLLSLGSAREIGPDDDVDAQVKRDAIPALPAGAKPGLEPEGEVPEGDAGQPEGEQVPEPEVDATQEQKPVARRRRR